MLQLQRIDWWLPVLFFSVLLLVGILIHRDYGISWDEPQQRRLGLATWDYVSGKNNDLLSNDNSYLNPFIGLLEVLPEKILQPESERAIWVSRHLINFIISWVGLVFFYLLALRLFRNYRYALLASVLFVLTPRLFAHFFYNSKDLPFLSLFTINAYLFLRWLEEPSWKKIIWMALTTGMLTGARVAGIFFPLIVICIAAVAITGKKWTRQQIMMVFTYLLLCPFGIYMFFPTFWQNPYGEFVKAVEIMSRHPYEVTSFFMGIKVHSLQTPWYYIPVWMAIVIPIGWWIFFMAGLAGVIASVIRKFSLQWLTLVVWLFLPLVTAIILHSSTYDDGRHLFFIYPPFLLIAVYGIRLLLESGRSPKKFAHPVPLLASVLLLITAGYTAVFMVKYHPYQFSYFNAIGRKYAAEYFEKDYWGLSYRSALEFLVKYDTGPRLNVNWQVDPCEWNLAWLNAYDRDRIHIDREDGHYDYYLTNFRSQRPEDVSDEKIYDLKVQGITIMAIYKIDWSKRSGSLQQ